MSGGDLVSLERSHIFFLQLMVRLYCFIFLPSLLLPSSTSVYYNESWNGKHNSALHKGEKTGNQRDRKDNK